jgi:hypothetical protein
MMDIIHFKKRIFSLLNLRAEREFTRKDMSERRGGGRGSERETERVY